MFGHSLFSLFEAKTGWEGSWIRTTIKTEIYYKRIKQSPQEEANAEAVQYDKMPEQLSEVQADPRVGIMIIIAPHHLRPCIPLDLPNELLFLRQPECAINELSRLATFCVVVRHVQHEVRSHFER